MAIPQSKNQYEPCSSAHFEALERTCRLRQLSGSGGKYFFQLAELIKARVLIKNFNACTKFSRSTISFETAVCRSDTVPLCKYNSGTWLLYISASTTRYHTFACATLFLRMKLIQLYHTPLESTKFSMVHAETKLHMHTKV